MFTSGVLYMTVIVFSIVFLSLFKMSLWTVAALKTICKKYISGPSKNMPHTKAASAKSQLALTNSSTKKLVFAAPQTAFTLFPELPPELRLIIWKMSIPGPRIVEVRCENPSWNCFNNQSVLPGSFSANRESRAATLKKDNLAFAPLFRQPVYFNFAIDTLYFPNYPSLAGFIKLYKSNVPRAADKKNKIRCIIVNNLYSCLFKRGQGNLVRPFKNLDTIVIQAAYAWELNPAVHDMMSERVGKPKGSGITVPVLEWTTWRRVMAMLESQQS
jgi:2EXR family